MVRDVMVLALKSEEGVPEPSRQTLEAGSAKQMDSLLELLEGNAALPTLWVQPSETHLGILTYRTLR